MDYSDLEVLKIAEEIADAIWRQVARWDSLAKDTVGRQLARSADSIGANIAEAFGRYHYADRARFFYFSRGSIFETKFWLNRCMTRGLLEKSEVQSHLAELTVLAKRLNALIRATKSQYPPKGIKEETSTYNAPDTELFSASELDYLASLEN